MSHSLRILTLQVYDQSNGGQGSVSCGNGCGGTSCVFSSAQRNAMVNTLLPKARSRSVFPLPLPCTTLWFDLGAPLQHRHIILLFWLHSELTPGPSQDY